MTDRKRVAFISTLNRGPWGGSEELWSRTAARLLDDGHAVTAEVRRWPDPVRAIAELQRKGARIVWRLPASSYSQRLRHLIREALPHWSGRWRPDFLLISSAEDRPSLNLLKSVYDTGVPFAVLIHVVSEVMWPDDLQAKDYVKYLSAAQACLFVSQASVALMNAKLGFRLRNARVVRNPFNVDYASAPRWPQDQGEYRMALVGRLDPGAKGQDVLFQVLSMEKWRQRALAVNLYGSGRCRETVNRHRQALGLTSVKLCGRTEDVEKIWEENHMLILPSREEGLPLALVEAMLCGRPALVTDVAGMTELIEDSSTGFVAEAPTTRSLDACLERAWRQRDQWERMGGLCAKRIRELVPPDPAGELKTQLVALMETAAAGARR
ncbi:MAG: glycosyltransferase family 4 protein [Candidatus Binatia bacterium]